LEKYYEKDCVLSQALLKHILKIDKEINSRLAYYLSEIVQEKKILSTQEKEALKQG